MKNFVLDPYQICTDYEVLFSFGEGSKVVLTETCLDILFKNEKLRSPDISKQARLANQYISELSYKGDLSEGIEQLDGSILQVEMNHKEIDVKSYDKNEYGYRLLQVCLSLIKNNEEVKLITNTPNLIVVAKIWGINAAQYRQKGVPVLEEQYTGRSEYFVDKEHYEIFKRTGELDFKGMVVKDKDENSICMNDDELVENKFISLKWRDSCTGGIIKGKKLYVLKSQILRDVEPKNIGQQFAIEALTLGYNEAPLVILKGPAGTAKTFLSIAAGLNQVEDKLYRKLLISRPASKLDEDLGYLPGSEEEKLAPYLRGIKDNIESFIFSGSRSKQNQTEIKIDTTVNLYFQNGTINIEAIAYMRGRSIFNNFILIDEGQNLTISQAKAIATRVGEGTKIVIVGDPSQIDNPALNPRNNGLSYISERFKGNKLCYQVTFGEDEVVRSELAKEATKLL